MCWISDNFLLESCRLILGFCIFLILWTHERHLRDSRKLYWHCLQHQNFISRFHLQTGQVSFFFDPLSLCALYNCVSQWCSLSSSYWPHVSLSHVFPLCLPLSVSLSLPELLSLLRLILYRWVSLSSPWHSPISISCHLSPITNPPTSFFFLSVVSLSDFEILPLSPQFLCFC